MTSTPASTRRRSADTVLRTVAPCPGPDTPHAARGGHRNCWPPSSSTPGARPGPVTAASIRRVCGVPNRRSGCLHHQPVRTGRTPVGPLDSTASVRSAVASPSPHPDRQIVGLDVVRGGDRGRRHGPSRVPAGLPGRHTAVPSPDEPGRRGRRRATHSTGCRAGTWTASAGSPTIPANSESSHPSSSQTNAQNRASTASELSDIPVFTPPTTADHHLAHALDNHTDLCLLM